MDFVDIDDVLVALLLDTVHDLLDAMFEVASILRACQERANVELVDATAPQTLRHLTFLDHTRQAPDEGRLAHTRLSYMQRIVLVATTEHLNRTLQLLFTAYQRIMVLIEIVHAGDEASPGGIRLLLASLLL